MPHKKKVYKLKGKRNPFSPSDNFFVAAFTFSATLRASDWWHGQKNYLVIFLSACFFIFQNFFL